MRFFNDDGTEINPDLIVKPSLCTTCINDSDESQYILCTLNRADQAGSRKFICGDYIPISDEKAKEKQKKLKKGGVKF